MRVENVENVTHKPVSHLIILKQIPRNQNSISRFGLGDFKNAVQGLHARYAEDPPARQTEQSAHQSVNLLYERNASTLAVGML